MFDIFQQISGLRGKAVAHNELGEYEKAIEDYSEAIRLNPKDSIAYNNLGHSYGKLGDHQKALEYYQKAMEIREKALPVDHPDIAGSCNNIAWGYVEQEWYAEAMKWERRALEIAERTLPKEHPDRRQYQESVAYLEKYC